MLHEMHEKMKHLQTKAHETDLYQLSEESLRNNAAKYLFVFCTFIICTFKKKFCTFKKFVLLKIIFLKVQLIKVQNTNTLIGGKPFLKKRLLVRRR